ncbi:hypothetical protein TRIHO_09170 [Tritonibacter horizontis]|uniref:Transposase InsH N-terminal domain-containing protein n=1 Tax=Tritonibacter horizontis TaxID=1768241 RepID=A0A132C0S3_9RHOB|nr:hypothetical protein TRIHO_09170 [Tritonibacter horizontis]
MLAYQAAEKDRARRGFENMIHLQHDSGGRRWGCAGRTRRTGRCTAMLFRRIVNDALVSLDAEFHALYTDFGRPSIAPGRLIRASLLQMLYSIRSERQLMEQMDYNLMFRWFVGLRVDDPV